MTTQTKVRKIAAEDLFATANSVWDSGDSKAALKVFREAAEAGHVSAKNSIGYFLDHGLGVRKNRTQAMLWYRKAARQGDLSAYSNIAISYRSAGKKRQARLWFAKAANRGDGGAAVDLAKLLLETHRKVDRAEALRRLRRAVRSKYISDDDRGQAAALIKSLEGSRNQHSTQ